MRVFVIFALFFSEAFSVSLRFKAPQFTPIILVPGDGGSQIYARYKGTDYLCPGGSDWFLIWVNLKFLLPFTEYCMSKYFKLNYNTTDHRTYNQPGVQTRIQEWGNTTSIEYLDTRHYSFLAYYGVMVAALVEKGYTRNVNIKGAPFDFRKAPNENTDFVPKMKVLVEETYTVNNATRVMIAAHSMGNLYTLYFLRRMTSAWKKKYIRGFIAISPPLGGAVKSVRAETSGDAINSAVFFLGPIREVLRSMPSTPFLFPSSHFWKPDEIFARRPGRNYTVTNYKELFTDMAFPDGWMMYQDTSTLVDPTWVPDVDELYCAHGVKLPTPETLEWTSDSSFPDTQPYVHYGDGDGTVNIRSLLGCLKWPGVKHWTYPDAEHVATLRDDRLIKDMIGVLIKS